jgi:Rad3-related DNA helicase
MQALASSKPLSIILTSGTLSPLEQLDKELGIPFKEKLSNDHVINESQIYPVIMGSGIHGRRFKFNFDTKDDHGLILELGYTLLDLCRHIRGGILVFFSSYPSMNDAFNLWLKELITFKIS